MDAAHADDTAPAANERVVLDATIVATPAADAGLALQLEAGRLTVTARLTDDTVDAPTYLTFRADRNSDPAAHIEIPVSSAGETTSVALAGGVYACRVHVAAPSMPDATLADVARYAQFVTLTITLAPA